MLTTVLLRVSVLACLGACTAIQPAIDSLRWTTPLDAKKETMTVTDAVAGARKTGSEEHKALLDKDPEKLEQASEDADAREKKLREDQQKEIDTLKKAQGELLSLVDGLYPGAGQALGAALKAGFRDATWTQAKDDSSEAAGEVKRLTEAGREVKARVDKVEQVVNLLDTDTLAALRKLDVARLQEIARGGNKDELVAAIRAQLADLELSPERIEELVSEAQGMSTTEIMALIATAIGGGALGTGGGRVFSRSGKRIDRAKLEIDELYDEVTKLREKNAQIETKLGK